MSLSKDQLCKICSHPWVDFGFFRFVCLRYSDENVHVFCAQCIYRASRVIYGRSYCMLACRGVVCNCPVFALDLTNEIVSFERAKYLHTLFNTYARIKFPEEVIGSKGHEDSDVLEEGETEAIEEETEDIESFTEEEGVTNNTEDIGSFTEEDRVTNNCLFGEELSFEEEEELIQSFFL